MEEKKLVELVDFLQDNTNLAELIINSSSFAGDSKTKNNPAGEYAVIERWLTSELERNNI